jgi:hypothetical protein
MTHDGGGAVYENLLFAGLLLVVLGIASLIVPIPYSETEGIKVGTRTSACRPATVNVCHQSFRCRSLAVPH